MGGNGLRFGCICIFRLVTRSKLEVGKLDDILMTERQLGYHLSEGNGTCSAFA